MKHPVDTVNRCLVGRVVFRYPSRGDAFYVIVDATEHTVVLKPLQAVQTMENPLILGQRGTEVPAAFDEAFVRNYDPKNVIRARRLLPDRPGEPPRYFYKSMLFILWDGKPLKFDAMD